MSLVVMRIVGLLLFPFSTWGEIPPMGPLLVPSFFELVDKVRQAKCFLCFSVQPYPYFVLHRLLVLLHCSPELSQSCLLVCGEVEHWDLQVHHLADVASQLEVLLRFN